MGFFDQTVQLVKHHESRVQVFRRLMHGKKSLHVGCADWPIYDPERNLHLALLSTIPNLHGYDKDEATLQKMSTLMPNALLASHLQRLSPPYEFILAPEVVEHVCNAGLFLEELCSLADQSTTIMLTAPNAFAPAHMSRNQATPTSFTEIVHPDHAYWFSPFTLGNLVRKALPDAIIKETGLLENETMVYVLFSKA